MTIYSINEAVDMLLPHLNLVKTSIIRNARGSLKQLSAIELLSQLVVPNSIKTISISTGYSERTLARITTELIRPLTGKLSGGSMWYNVLLPIIGCTYCVKCTNIKSIDEFVKNTDSISGINSTCRVCKSAYRAEFTYNNPEYARQDYINNSEEYKYRANIYRAAKLKRTPSWANLDKIKEIYRTCPEGYHVDHIVPLQGELVSGLHVEYNLQHLPASENLAKGNKFVT